MINKNLLKSFLVGSWLLVIYAATPYSPDGTRWLAGVALALSYFLAGVVLGATDQEALDIVRKETLAIEDQRNAQRLMFAKLTDEHYAAMNEIKEATTRVSKAISELRRLDSQRFE